MEMRTWMLAAVLFYLGVGYGVAEVGTGEPTGPTFDTSSWMSTQIGERAAPITLESMKVRASVDGLLTRISTTLTFRNPFDRQVEGELVFPLPQGARVSGYALDVGGVMVDAVPVTRRRARVAFEAEVRRRVDPGLVEWARGNHFKTRIYPFPPKGTRTIRIEVTGRLALTGVGSRFRLPLRTPGPVGAVEVDLVVEGPKVADVALTGAPAGMTMGPWHGIFRAEGRFADQALDHELVVTLPPLEHRSVRVERYRGETTFLVQDTPPLPTPKRSKASLETLCIVWDASASRAGKHDREIELLTRFIEAHPSLKTLRLYALRNRLTEHYIPAKVDFLRRTLETLPYDGATQLGAIRLTPEHGDLALLFTDGVSTWGSSQAKSAIPVYAFSSSSGTEHEALADFAARTGGFYQRLYAQTAIPSVVSRIGRPSLRFLRAEYDEDRIYALHPKAPRQLNGPLLCTGKLSGDRAELTLVYGVGERETLRRRVVVTRRGMEEGSRITRFWASQELNHLLKDRDANAEAVTALGKEYGLVTPGTSLIVLERLSQYLEHEIRPPAMLTEMRRQYNLRMVSRSSRRGVEEGSERDRRLKGLLYAWEDRLVWYDPTYKRTLRPRSTSGGGLFGGDDEGSLFGGDDDDDGFDGGDSGDDDDDGGGRRGGASFQWYGEAASRGALHRVVS
ncbi:MAG: VIT domain-containing protein, partial [Planctomycetota bacterium]